MKVLVTGSSGYIGSSFINKFYKNYSFVKFSLQTQKLEDIDFSGIDVVLHCAALVHQKKVLSYDEYYDVNVNYTVNLAKLAKDNKVKKFIFISTIAVYGDNKSKLNEESECNPNSFYGKSKFEAEKELINLGNKNFLISIIRLPMIYGQNAPGNIKSLQKLIKNSPIIPLKDTKNKRTFVFIDNLCYSLNEIVLQQKSGIFIISDDNSISTSKLISLIAENLNRKIYLVKIPFFDKILKLIKPSFYKRLYGNLEVDNSITKNKLNLKNPYSVERGIELMIRGEK